MFEILKDKIEVVKIWSRNYGKVFLIFICVLSVIFYTGFVFLNKESDELKVVFFDVGQGDSIFIETPSHKQMLIDGGPNNKVLEKLASEMSFFDKEIDVVVATHADADHITGLIPVFEKYNVKNIITSSVKGKTSIFEDLDKHIDLEKNNGANLYVGKQGDEIDFQDGVIAKIIYPFKSISQKEATNEASIVILLTYNDKTFLLTGDLPTSRENYLLSSGVLPKNITVHKAGHHGSKTSSGEQLLSYIKPYYSVISAGKDNRYGHPNMETLDRLKKYSKVILNTINDGDISFVTDGESFRFEMAKK